MDKDRKKQNIKKISEVNSGLSPIDLYTAYIKSFEKRYKKELKMRRKLKISGLYMYMVLFGLKKDFQCLVIFMLQV
jgi:hypothetical protein